MDLKEALPTSAIHNKYTDLNLGCRQCIGLWTSPPAPLSHGPEPLENNCLRQPFMNERTFVEAQVVGRESLAHPWSERKKKYGHVHY